MSWEWRVFWEIPEDGEGVLGSLGLKRQPLAREVRSDTYIPCTGEVGIKWRRGRQLEVKVMTEKDEKSGAEKWSKILATNCPYLPTQANSDDIKSFLINQLDKFLGKGNYRERLGQAKTMLLTTPTLQFYELHKERSYEHINGCSYELTTITSPAFPKHQSLCVEINKRHIDRFLTTPTVTDGRKNMSQFFGEIGRSCGYPQFVIDLTTKK